MRIKDFLEAIQYKITEGNQYQWECYGENAFTLEYWDGQIDGKSCSITFNTENQAVGDASVCDFENDRAYRWINPLYKKQVFEEAKRRNVDNSYAWETVKFCDVDDYNEFLNILREIIGTTQVEQATVELDLTHDECYKLMLLAHKNDITLNQLVEEIILQYLNSR